MAEMTLSDLLVIAERLGLVGFMLAGYWGLVKGWWVPGGVYRDMKCDRDKWQESSAKQTKLNERLVGIVDADG